MVSATRIPPGRSLRGELRKRTSASGGRCSTSWAAKIPPSEPSSTPSRWQSRRPGRRRRLPRGRRRPCRRLRRCRDHRCRRRGGRGTHRGHNQRRERATRRGSLRHTPAGAPAPLQSSHASVPRRRSSQAAQRRQAARDGRNRRRHPRRAAPLDTADALVELHGPSAAPSLGRRRPVRRLVEVVDELHRRVVEARCSAASGSTYQRSNGRSSRLTGYATAPLKPGRRTSGRSADTGQCVQPGRARSRGLRRSAPPRRSSSRRCSKSSMTRPQRAAEPVQAHGLPRRHPAFPHGIRRLLRRRKGRYGRGMRVGLSLLTLVPGLVGGWRRTRVSSAGARAPRRARLPGFVPPVAPDAANGLPAAVVSEYRARTTMPGRMAAMSLADSFYPERIRRRLTPPRRDPLPAQRDDPGGRRPPAATTVHDLQHELYPAFFSRAELATAARSTGGRSSAAGSSSRSPSTRGRRSSSAGRSTRSGVRTIHLGIDHERFTPDAATSASSSSSTRRTAGRTRTTTDCSRRSRSCGREARAPARAHGHRPRRAGRSRRSRSRAGTSRRIALVDLYRSARCLVFPSLYEGFGLPPLEAMACGCPVAVANATSLPEVCGDAAEYFDPLSPEDMAACDPPRAKGRSRREGLVRAAGFTWETAPTPTMPSTASSLALDEGESYDVSAGALPSRREPVDGA